MCFLWNLDSDYIIYLLKEDCLKKTKKTTKKEDCWLMVHESERLEELAS